MPLDTPKALFIHQLTSLYAMEKAIAGMLLELAGEVNDVLLKDRLRRHEQETGAQIKNLEAVFARLNMQPHAVKSQLAEGLAAAHQEFKKQDPAAEVLEMFDVGAASKTEALEIAAYHGLISRARQMNAMEIAHLLEQNLSQDKEMLHALQQLAHTLGKSAALKRAA